MSKTLEILTKEVSMSVRLLACALLIFSMMTLWTLMALIWLLESLPLTTIQRLALCLMLALMAILEAYGVFIAAVVQVHNAFARQIGHSHLEARGGPARLVVGIHEDRLLCGQPVGDHNESNMYESCQSKATLVDLETEKKEE